MMGTSVSPVYDHPQPLSCIHHVVSLILTDHVSCFNLQIKKAEMDRKTLDWEIVELTNKLLDAKTTINRLEELNVSKVCS